MKKILVIGQLISKLHICEFGYAEGTLDTFWGNGYRNQHIVHYVLSGKGYYNGNPVGENQGFVIEPQKNAEYHFDESDPWKYFWFVTTGELASEICKNHIPTNENGIFDYKFHSSLSNIVNKLFFSSGTKSEATISETAALSELFKILSYHDSVKEMGANKYVENAKRFIELNLYRPITVKDIAAIQNISDRYLYNLFVRHEGISPKQYLSEMRLKTAENMLETTKLSVTEIAESVGYKDVLAFSRFFVDHTGISPMSFRKQMNGR